MRHFIRLFWKKTSLGWLCGLTFYVLGGNASFGATESLRNIESSGFDVSDAISRARKAALNKALSNTGLSLKDDQIDALYSKRDLFMNHTLIDERESDAGVNVVLDVFLDKDIFGEMIAKYFLADASSALGKPNILFAVVPRAPEGEVLDRGTSQFFIETVNQTMQEVFFDSGFNTIYPEWLLENIRTFKGDPAHIEALHQNTIALAKSERNTHYVVLGTVTVDTQRGRNGKKASVVLNGQILRTFNQGESSIPFNYSAQTEGGEGRALIEAACQIVGKRAASIEAVPRMVSDWEKQIVQGVTYHIDLLYRSDDFVEDMLTALQSVGEIHDMEQIGEKWFWLRYQSTAFRRADFANRFLFMSRFKDTKPAGRPYIGSKSGHIVIAEDDPLIKPQADLVLAGQGYTLIDLESIPGTRASIGGSSNSQVPSATAALAMTARRFAEAVGVVSFQKGGVIDPSATAWAFSPTRFASNAHVTVPVAEALKRGESVYIYLNRQKGKRVKVTKAVTHPKYKPGRYDVGWIEVAEPVETYWPLADDDTLRELDTGTSVAFLGFPMEGLNRGNLNLEAPLATLQTGIITSISDYEMRDTSFEDRVLLRHNLPATGGASGSPIFNEKGEVVGLLNAGNIIGQVVRTDDGATITRAPSAVLINFGQRVDLLTDIVPR